MILNRKTTTRTPFSTKESGLGISSQISFWNAGGRRLHRKTFHNRMGTRSKKQLER
jgi:hypothetical protein